MRTTYRRGTIALCNSSPKVSRLAGESIFIISNNRRARRNFPDTYRPWPRRWCGAVAEQHVAASLMTADISQTSRTTKYADVTTTSNDRRPAVRLPLEFGEQKFKHESMNPTNAQNPNKCPARLQTFSFLFFFLFFFSNIRTESCTIFYLRQLEIFTSI